MNLSLYQKDGMSQLVQMGTSKEDILPGQRKRESSM